MPKFEVVAVVSKHIVVKVDADNEDEARDLAGTKILSDLVTHEVHFSKHDLIDEEDWVVRPA